MSMTGFEAFDKAVQKSEIWLKSIMRELNTDNRKSAYVALRTVLHTLRDRLTVDEAADLGAQLPLLIRGIYYEEWDPSQTPIKYRHIDEFLTAVEDKINSNIDTDVKSLAKAVFKTLQLKVTEGEIMDVKGMMPAELRTLWE